MKTAKEKAIELFEKYYKLVDKSRLNKHDNQPELNAKQCALITVLEILKVCEDEISHCSDKTYFYWQEVKIEIEKL
jgi:hypothetical protein